MIIIGSARISENGTITGKAGDQTGTEVSKQEFYVHSKGWNIIRAKSPRTAMRLGMAMEMACDNENIGYDQYGRYGVIQNGIETDKATEADCSSLVRECVRWAAGVDPGDFTTSNERKKLLDTGLFDDIGKYETGTVLCTGDILVTCKKGHTVIVTAGKDRTIDGSYYPRNKVSTYSIVDALHYVGERDTSKAHRARIADANGIINYRGSATQNLLMLMLLNQGKLLKAD